MLHITVNGTLQVVNSENTFVY